MDTKINRNKKLITEALIPVVALIAMLGYVAVYRDDALSGSSQFVLLLGAAVAAIVCSFLNKVTFEKKMMEGLLKTSNQPWVAILILLMVGAL
jgi:NhaC family Na+:H+ antiporter